MLELGGKRWQRLRRHVRNDVLECVHVTIATLSVIVLHVIGVITQLH